MMKQESAAGETRPQMTIDRDRMIARAADFGFRLADPGELVAAVAVTEALVGARIAPIAVIARMQAHTGISTWVTGDPVDGFFFFAPLTFRGLVAVRSGTLSPAAAGEDDLAPAGAPCSGVYVGVYAGATHQARKNIMTVSAVLRSEMFGDVPFFARGATEDGARSMRSLGFVPVIGAMPDLFVHEPVAVQKADAA